jgi:hypothetical protein
MSEAEARLASFWAESEAPARDLVFELGVEQAIARRKLLIDIAGFLGAALVLAGALVAFGPTLAAGAPSLAASLDPAGPVLAAAAAIAAALAWLGRAPDEA